MFVRLSYDITAQSPGWPGNPTMQHRYYSHVAEGDVATHSILTIFSHFGSHIDAPSHVDPLGAGICDLDLGYFVFEAPLLIDIPKGEREFVRTEDLVSLAADAREHDLLLIRTGWSRVRQEDASHYAANGPALDSDAAKHIVEKFPGLRAIGIDSISFGSPHDIEEAIATHEILSGKRTRGRPLVNIEDIRLNIDQRQLRRVFALPLFAENLEGSPCTVIAELDQADDPTRSS